MPAPRVLRLLPPGGALPQAFQRSFRRHAPRLQVRRRRRPQWSFRCHVPRWDLVLCHAPRRALSFRCRLAPSGALLPPCRHALEYGAFAPPPLCSRERDVRPSVTPSSTSTSLAPSGLFAATFLGRAPSASAPAALVALPPPCPPRLQARRRRRPQRSFRCHVPRRDLVLCHAPPAGLVLPLSPRPQRDARPPRARCFT